MTNRRLIPLTASCRLSCRPSSCRLSWLAWALPSVLAARRDDRWVEPGVGHRAAVGAPGAEHRAVADEALRLDDRSIAPAVAPAAGAEPEAAPGAEHRAAAAAESRPDDRSIAPAVAPAAGAEPEAAPGVEHRAAAAAESRRDDRSIAPAVAPVAGAEPEAAPGAEHRAAAAAEFRLDDRSIAPAVAPAAGAEPEVEPAAVVAAVAGAVLLDWAASCLAVRHSQEPAPAGSVDAARPAGQSGAFSPDSHRADGQDSQSAPAAAARRVPEEEAARFSPPPGGSEQPLGAATLVRTVRIFRARSAGWEPPPRCSLPERIGRLWHPPARPRFVPAAHSQTRSAGQP